MRTGAPHGQGCHFLSSLRGGFDEGLAWLAVSSRRSGSQSFDGGKQDSGYRAGFGTEARPSFRAQMNTAQKLGLAWTHAQTARWLGSSESS